MICKACRRQDHEACPGGTWCDCQHKEPSALRPEPSLDWLRQG